MGLQKRVLNPLLNDTAPIADIKSVDNCTFIPNFEECRKLDEHFIYHITNVLVKYVGCLKKYKDCVPKFIQNPHLKELAEKSNFVLLDMLDKSENKSEDMITILEHIYMPITLHILMEKIQLSSRKKCSEVTCLPMNELIQLNLPC